PSFEWLQAIGNEVAAETSRSALMSVPARTVAVSRKEATLNMIKPLCIVSSNPTVGSVPLSMQGACQTEVVVIFQYGCVQPQQIIAQVAPNVGEKYQGRC